MELSPTYPNSVIALATSSTLRPSPLMIAWAKQICVDMRPVTATTTDYALVSDASQAVQRYLTVDALGVVDAVDELDLALTVLRMRATQRSVAEASGPLSGTARGPSIAGLLPPSSPHHAARHR